MNKYLFHKCSAGSYSHHPSQSYIFFFFFTKMEKGKKDNSILLGLSTSSLTTLQLIFHPAATVLCLKLKPAEATSKELHDFEDNVYPFNLTYKISHGLLLAYLSSLIIS